MATGFYLLDNVQPTTLQYGYPRRGAVLSGTCIIHTAECAMDLVGDDSSAENCANFIRGRADYGSYHTLVDSDSIIEMVPYEYEAWQDSQTNPWAVGISAAVAADRWNTIPAARRDSIYRNLAKAGADFVRYMRTKSIEVPIRKISGDEARNRVPGFCAHGDSGVDRHDPGVQFEWDKFFRYIKEELAGTATTQEEESEMPTSSRVDSAMPARHRLPKGKAYTLSVKDDGAAANFAINGVGHYVITNYLRGEGLGDGERIEAQFFLTKNGRASGHFVQDIRGSVDGKFNQPIFLNRKVESGTTITCKLTAKNSENAYVLGFGAEVTTYK